MSAISPFRETGSPEEFETVDLAPVAFEGGPFVQDEGPEWEAEAFFDEAEEEAAAHPILKLFPLPSAVLDALSRGLWSLALGLAVGAGYRDVTQLTNIIFYFRHPEVIGRKIRSDERDLARDWLAIRDRIVKPALKSITPAAPPAPTPAAPPTGGDTKPSSPPIPASRVQWTGASPGSPEELAFKRAVYEQHFRRARSKPGNTYVADLPDSALEWIDKAKRHRLRKDAAAQAKELFKAAQKKLDESPHAGRRQIGVVSSYRTAEEQFRIWQGRPGKGFHGYYQRALNEKLAAPGDYGPEAVKAVAHRLGRCVGFPGYSNHQDGLAMDLGEGAVGKGLSKLREGTWFHGWLRDNAEGFHFHPLKDEPWHWVYRPPAESEIWSGEVGTAGVRAGGVSVDRVPLFAGHRGKRPDLLLRWNDMPSVPEEIDVVVHLHGYWYAGMTLPNDIERVSGLDLAPIEGATGQGRTRPTLTVLPRGHDTGDRQRYKQKDGTYKYGYNRMTFPALVKKHGLSELIRVSLERFAQEVGGTAPRVGRLILTAHSGGGLALLEILKLRDPDPHQVHVFDALYWRPDALVDWARRHIGQDRDALAGKDASAARDYMTTRGGALRVFFQGSGTRGNSVKLRSAISRELGEGLEQWYRVEESTYGHFGIPRQYGWRVLADASADVPGIKAARRPVRHEASLEEGELEECPECAGRRAELYELDEDLEDLPAEVFEATAAAEWEAPEAWHEEDGHVHEWEEPVLWEVEDFAGDDEASDESPDASFEGEPDEESLEPESEPELSEALLFEAGRDGEAELYEEEAADEDAAPEYAELPEMLEREEDEDLWEAPLEEAPVEEEWSTEPISHEDTAPGREAEMKLIEWALHKGGSPGEDLIVNLVFHRRHPELKGRTLRASETALVREWRAIRDTQVRPYVRHSLQLKGLDPVLLATYLSQYEGDRRVPVDAQMTFLWEPPLLSMGRTLRDRVLWNWHSGGRPLTADRFFDLAYELTGNTGYAALLCHNVAKAFSKGGVAIHWKKVEGGEGLYTGSGKQWKARIIHRDGVVLRTATGPSIFYVLFSAKEFGTEDHGDWYHYFVAATMTAFGTIADRAAGRGGGQHEQGELEAGAYTETILSERPNPLEAVEQMAYPILLRDALGRLRHQMSDPVGAATAGHSGWVLGNVLSFLEGAYYGKSQQEVARETRIHLRGAIFGVERARGTVGPTWRWFVPKAGSVSKMDLVTGFTLSAKTAEVLPAIGAAVPAAAASSGAPAGHGR